MKYAIMYRSTEHGATWQHLTVIADSENAAREYVQARETIIGSENLIIAPFSTTTPEHQERTDIETVNISAVMDKAADLSLYAVNNGTLYRSATLPALDTLARDMLRNTFTIDSMKKAMYPIAKKAACMYNREFPETTFTAADIKHAADDMQQHYVEYVTEKADDMRPAMVKAADLYKEYRRTLEKADKEKKAGDTLADMLKFNYSSHDGTEKSTLARIAAAEKKETNLRTAAAIIKNNARISLFFENIENIVTVWNRYTGKQYGEKTAEKIKAEIKELTGCYFWLVNDYAGHSDGFTISPVNIPGNDWNVTAHTLYHDGNRNFFVNEHNTMQAISADDIRISYINRVYVYDIAYRVKELQKLYEQAYKAQETLRAACSAYMNLHVDGLPEVNARDTIYRRYYINR